MSKCGVRSSLAVLRAKRGMGPAELAAKAGISRQTVYAIEAGIYVPNTAVSLRLARALAASVEDIFQLEPEEAPPLERAEAAVLGDPSLLSAGLPLRLCRVDNRLVAVAPEPGSWGLPSTDAILLSIAKSERNDSQAVRAAVQILAESWQNPGRILLAGCDPSASILANSVPRQSCEILVAYENSSRALELLRDGLVHVAGTHLQESPGDRTSVAAMFPPDSVAVFSYAEWREGFVVAHGNPKRILSVEDLVRKDVRIANREPGAGCRQLLDRLLDTAGISPSKVQGYERMIRGQLPAARLVQSGEVDCCVCAEAGARTLGLDFVPLANKPYQLAIRRKDLGLPSVQALLETLGHLAFRREVQACVGYDMHSSGEQIS